MKILSRPASKSSQILSGRRWARFVGLLLIGQVAVWAHEGPSERIAVLTKKIRQEPRADLYVKRGELYRALRHWPAALADYDRAAQLDPRLAVVDLVRGRALLESGRQAEAKAALDRFLAGQPGHAEGLLTRARALVKLRRYGEASEEYSRAIARMEKQTPEYYLERAQAQVDAGQNPDVVLRGLDEGIRRLGPLVTLERSAIKLELRNRRYEQALERLGRIAAQSPRQEFWLAERGQILAQAGRPGEARAAYQAALAAIGSLPPARRNASVTVELENRLHAALRKQGETSIQ